MPAATSPSDRTAVSGSPAGTEPSNHVHYTALDGLRTLAFVMVFLAHYYAMPWGFGGVNFFFVLSGFLITGILWDTRTRPHRARNFYLRRTLRIFPLYYGVIFIFLLTTPLFHWRWSLPWLAWPLYLGNFLRAWGHNSTDPAVFAQTYAQLHSQALTHDTIYFGHFWSLCVEEQFYLLWPWIVFRISSRKALLALCSTIIVVEPFLRSFVQGHSPAWVTQREVVYTFGVPFQLDSLLLGALLALLWQGGHRALLQNVAQVLLAGLVLFLAGYVLWESHVLTAPWRHTYQYPTWRITWGLTLLNLYGAALVIRALDPGSLTYRVLNLAPLRAFGRITYGAYVFHDLVHGPCIHLLLHLSVHRPWLYAHIEEAVAVLAFCITLVLSALSFRFFEGPILKLKDKWAPSRSFSSGVVST